MKNFIIFAIAANIWLATDGQTEARTVCGYSFLRASFNTCNKMKTKKCSKCGIVKPITEFSPNKHHSDGLQSACKSCRTKAMLDRVHTKDGLITKIYSAQRSSSRERNHPYPLYTKIQFKEWILSKKEFNELFEKWERSGFKTELTPSCDRLDDYKPYSFDNLRLTTWKENKRKGHLYRRIGLNNKDSKAVIQFDFNGNIIKEFYSINQAERETGINHSNISQACRGRYKSAGGFIWKYKTETK